MIPKGNISAGFERGFYYGAHLTTGKGKFWFAVWCGPWGEYGKTSLWIQAVDPKAEEHLMDRDIYAKSPVVPVEIPRNASDPSEVIKKVKEKLLEIIR